MTTKDESYTPRQREMTFVSFVCLGGVASRCAAYMWERCEMGGHRDGGYLGCAFTTGGCLSGEGGAGQKDASFRV